MWGVHTGQNAERPFFRAILCVYLDLHGVAATTSKSGGASFRSSPCDPLRLGRELSPALGLVGLVIGLKGRTGSLGLGCSPCRRSGVPVEVKWRSHCGQANAKTETCHDFA